MPKAFARRKHVKSEYYQINEEWLVAGREVRVPLPIAPSGGERVLKRLGGRKAEAA